MEGFMSRRDLADQKFAGKVALVTGGAKGFGRAFGVALAERGATVVLADVDAEGVAATASELRADGLKVTGVQCDVANDGEVDATVERITGEFGGPDILINNAGKHLSKYNQPFSVLSRQEVRSLFDVNVMGVVNCSVACLKPMRARGGGVIVNISSMAAYMSQSPYGVSKLAVRGLTIAFAQEFSSAGIRCNAIAPGLMATESAMEDLPAEMISMVVETQQLVPRLGQVDDIVAMMLFLCSTEASFITGETYRVSGGTPLSI
jgi:NAD(P)-dependent dehydrogenase (short-subunit alcohol dehydrogenase family)